MDDYSIVGWTLTIGVFFTLFFLYAPSWLIYGTENSVNNPGFNRSTENASTTIFGFDLGSSQTGSLLGDLTTTISFITNFSSTNPAVSLTMTVMLIVTALILLFKLRG